MEEARVVCAAETRMRLCFNAWKRSSSSRAGEGATCCSAVSTDSGMVALVRPPTGSAAISAVARCAAIGAFLGCLLGLLPVALAGRGTEAAENGVGRLVLAVGAGGTGFGRKEVHGFLCAQAAMVHASLSASTHPSAQH